MQRIEKEDAESRNMNKTVFLPGIDNKILGEVNGTTRTWTKIQIRKQRKRDFYLSWLETS